jgi:hypothetical protein
MSIFDDIKKSMMGEMEGQELTSPEEQQPEDKKIIGYIKGKLDTSRSNSSRLVYEGIWMTNIAYILGYSGYIYDPMSRVYKNTDRPRRGVAGRVRVNKILPTVQNRAARLVKQPPKYDVRPESSEPEDKDAARLGLDIIRDVWDRQEINQKRINLAMVIQQAGYGFIHVAWDDQLGRPMVDPETNELDYEGDIRIDVVSPFEVYVDPVAKNMEETNWVIRCKVRKLDYFRTRFPERGHLVKEESAWLQSVQYDLRTNNITGVGFSGDSAQSMMKDSAIEIVYYERRSRKHPNGRMITIAHDVLLEDKELPTGDIPLVKFDDIVVGNRFMAESVVTHLRPIQDRYDRLMAKRDQYIQKVLAGKYIAARGHGLISEAIDDQTGEVVEYDPVPNAAPPQAMSVPQLPQYAYAEEDRLNEQFDQVSGINEISRGVLPSAGIPAIGMQFLQEQDETRLGVETTQHEMAWAKVGSLILKYAAKFYVMPRMMKLAGPTGDWVVKQYTGQDLRDNFDVIVVPGSTSPQSKVLRRQDILTAYREGLLGDPKDPKVRQQVLSQLEYGDIEELWQDQAVNDAQIAKQIKEIENGIVPERNENDDHIAHYTQKNRYRKTEKFERLSPRSQAIMLDDIQYHLDELIRLANPNAVIDEELAKEMQASSEMMPEGELMPEEPMPIEGGMQ